MAKVARKEPLNTMEDLTALQKLPLDMKIQLSKDRIREYSEYLQNKIYVLFFIQRTFFLKNTIVY